MVVIMTLMEAHLHHLDVHILTTGQENRTRRKGVKFYSVLQILWFFNSKLFIASNLIIYFNIKIKKANKILGFFIYIPTKLKLMNLIIYSLITYLYFYFFIICKNVCEKLILKVIRFG